MNLKNKKELIKRINAEHGGCWGIHPDLGGVFKFKGAKFGDHKNILVQSTEGFWTSINPGVVVDQNGNSLTDDLIK